MQKTDMIERKINSKLNKLFKKAIDKHRLCFHPNCNEKAINSHILQKKGILSGISKNGQIYVSKTDFLNNELFVFRKSGINVTYTFKGFCQKHDKKIFEPIEDYEVDFEEYTSNLLFAYRTILSEKRKKEILINWNNLQLEDSLLRPFIIKDNVQKATEGYHLALDDIDYYVGKMHSDLFEKTENFVFRVRYTKPVDICLSSHFTYESTRQRQEEIRKTGKDFDRLTDIFISFFPLENENVLLLGYLKESERICTQFVESFFIVEEDELFYKISNLLLRRCEQWACSEDFYFKKIKSRDSEINSIFREAADSLDEDKEIDFNIFIE